MIGFIIFILVIVIWYLYIHYKNKNEFENKNTLTMNYDEKIIIATIKRFYPIEVKVEHGKLPLKFYKKENEEHFLAFELIRNTDMCAIYLFKSENLNDTDKFFSDFNNDIAFQIEDLETLKIILEANSLIS